MTFRCEMYDPVILLRWEAVPTVADVESIVGEVAKFAASADAPDFVIVVPVEVGRLPTKVRDAFSQNLSGITERCRSVQLVLEGEGFARVAVRSIAAGLLLLKGEAKMHINDSIEEAIVRTGCSPERQQEILKAARAAGIIDDAKIAAAQ